MATSDRLSGIGQPRSLRDGKTGLREAQEGERVQMDEAMESLHQDSGGDQLEFAVSLDPVENLRRRLEVMSERVHQLEDQGPRSYAEVGSVAESVTGDPPEYMSSA